MDGQKSEITIERRELTQIAQQVHQGYHQERSGTWRECPMAVCARIRSVLGVPDPVVAVPEVVNPAPGPWTRSDLDEWRCPNCGAMAYTPKSEDALMLGCATCPGLVWMERLLGVAA